MQTQFLGDELLTASFGGRHPADVPHPGMVRLFVRSTATNSEALSAMTLYDIGTLMRSVKTTDFVGVVERDQLPSKLVVWLATDRMHRH